MNRGGGQYHAMLPSRKRLKSNHSEKAANMGETWEKLKLLLWKNLLIQIRRRKKLLLDIFIPLFVGAFLVYVRYSIGTKEVSQPTNFFPFSPSYIPKHEPVWKEIRDLGLVDHDVFYNSDGSPKFSLEDIKNWKMNSSMIQLTNNKTLNFGADSSIMNMLKSASTGKWTVMWSPDNRELKKVMEKACEKMSVNCLSVKDSDTLDEHLSEPSEYPEAENALAGVAFPDEIAGSSEIPSKMDVKIRFPAERRYSESRMDNIIPSNWLTGLVFPAFQLTGPREPKSNEGGSPGYYVEGFLGLENAVLSSLLEYRLENKKPEQNVNVDVKLQRFPYPSYVFDPMLTALHNMLPILIVISFLFSVNNLVETITTEKEKRLKVVMNIMGLSNSLRWTSWYIHSFIFFSILIIILILVFKVPLIDGVPIFPNSDWTCLLVFFICYSSAVITFCFLMSTIFSRGNECASVASIVAGMTWLLLFLPFSMIQPNYAETETVTKVICSIFLNSAMSIGLQVILLYEGAGSGIQWGNMAAPVNVDDEMTLVLVLVLMLLDGLLYLSMALYIENVFPGEYGSALPWYYPLQRSYWFGDKRVDDEFGLGKNEREAGNEFEEEPKNIPAGIQIRNLCKVYRGSSKPAVQNLTLNVYEGEITVLMGFNGAGKTTTFSILTGIYPPTSGTATVNGYDVNTNMNEVRKNLGFCPQYNVLFDELTVEEHIKFFSKLKGLKDDQIKKETDKYIAKLNLKDKRYTSSKHLSGGMKRKLSVALALCGNTKVLLFDEPSAGMDPKARRGLWDLLISEKKGRSILLTTHFLDEADLLGDRVAIMCEGKLHCYGTTFFLKKKFSCGYHLIIVKKDDCKTEEVNAVIERHVPETLQYHDIGRELSYQLPEKYTYKFESLLNDIETLKESLGIISYGISPTSLEDVFMRIADEETDYSKTMTKPETSADGLRTDTAAVSVPEVYKLKGKRLLGNQITAMFYKHLKSTQRSWKTYLTLIGIAVLGVLNGMMTIRANEKMLVLPPRILDLRDFPEGIIFSRIGEKCEENCLKLHNQFDKIIQTENVHTTVLNSTTLVPEYLLSVSEKNIYDYRSRYVFGVSFDDIESSQVSVRGWFNPQPFHVPPTVLAYIYNALLQAFDNEETRVTFVNEPLRYTKETKVKIQEIGADAGFQVALFIAFSYVFIASFFVTFYVQERANKAKLLQFVSGVNYVVFWGSAFLWNMLMILGPNIALLATLASFQEEGYSEPIEILYCAVILTSFFVSVLPMMYVASLVFTKPALGYIRMTFFNIITGIYTAILILIFQMPVLDLLDVAEILDWIFAIFPMYSMAHSLHFINTASKRIKMCKPIYEDFCQKKDNFIDFCCKVPEKCPPSGCLEWTEEPLGWELPGVGRYLTLLYASAAALFLLLMLIEYNVFGPIANKLKRTEKNWKTSGDKDSDVIEESERVRGILDKDRKNWNLLIDGISKSFRKITPVKGLHLAVSNGECFGLLGTNGAGKTTTFKILTGDDSATAGNVYVRGLSIKNNKKKIYQLIGYCPQFDALFEDLTGREHLRLYCLLRGIPKSDIHEITTKVSNELLFHEYLDKKVSEYSGGNKRKLSTALALIGDPPLVYLDEPTAGIDPVAKRHLWAVISKVRARGTTIILTSHSMEECEALCTRLAIMVKGEFKCLGSSQYLKNKFCQGYSLSIKVRKHLSEMESGDQSSKTYLDEVKRFVSDTFPGAKATEEHEELIVHQIPFSNLSWSKMFGLIEEVKDQLKIEDYSLGQTTLEQILLMFTEKDPSDDDD